LNYYVTCVCVLSGGGRKSLEVLKTWVKYKCFVIRVNSINFQGQGRYNFVAIVQTLKRGFPWELGSILLKNMGKFLHKHYELNFE